MEKHPILDTIRVQDSEVEISLSVILWALFGEAFEPTKETLKYDFLMNDLKRVTMLSVDDKMMHYRWVASHITEAGENFPYINESAIYKHTLKYTVKVWWSFISHQIAPTTNNSTFGATNAYRIADFISKRELNISWIITENILDRVLQFRTILPFLYVISQLMRSAYIPNIGEVYWVIQLTKVVDLALIKNMRNSTALMIGLEIPNIVRGSPTIDLPISNSDGSFSFGPLATIHS